MNDNNVKKRNTLSFDEFLKNKVVVVKGENDIVAKSYSGEEKGNAGVATLDTAKKIRPVKEAYDMNTDEGDIDEEHAKAVISKAIDNSHKDGIIDLKKAFDDVCGEQGVNSEDENDKEVRGMIHSSLIKFVENLAQLVKDPMLGK